jgi:hypothetical protein
MEDKAISFISKEFGVTEKGVFKYASNAFYKIITIINTIEQTIHFQNVPFTPGDIEIIEDTLCCITLAQMDKTRIIFYKLPYFNVIQNHRLPAQVVTGFQNEFFVYRPGVVMKFDITGVFQDAVVIDFDVDAESITVTEQYIIIIAATRLGYYVNERQIIGI